METTLIAVSTLPVVMTGRRTFLRGVGVVGSGVVTAGCTWPTGVDVDGEPTPGTTTPEQTTERTTTTSETTTTETTTTETASGTTTATGGVTEVDAGPEGRLRFVPADVEVPVGGTVRWTFLSPGHNVTSKPGASEKCLNPEGAEPFASYEGDRHYAVVPVGETYEHTFTVAGEYVYVCEPHADQGMVGTVTVSG